MNPLLILFLVVIVALLAIEFFSLRFSDTITNWIDEREHRKSDLKYEREYLKMAIAKINQEREQ